MLEQSPYVAPEANTKLYKDSEPQTLTQLLFSFEGRAKRKHYWLFALAAVVFSISVSMVSFLFLSDALLDPNASSLSGFTIFILLLQIPLMWAGLAIQVKRWHDRNKSGWWVFITLVPLIGAIWALVENGFLSGTEGRNRFGSPV